MTAITNFVRPRYFLLLAGAVLVLMGLSGVVGLLASISRASVFNPPYWINWVHLTFGIVVLAIALAGGRVLQNVMTVAAVFIGITLGLSGLLLARTPRTFTASRSWQTRPTISHMSLSGCWLSGHG